MNDEWYLYMDGVFFSWCLVFFLSLRGVFGLFMALGSTGFVFGICPFKGFRMPE